MSTPADRDPHEQPVPPTAPTLLTKGPTPADDIPPTGVLAREESTDRSTPAPIAAGDSVPQPELPGYAFLRELGRGGMGVVYLARQSHLNRIVAVKMILAGAHAGSEDVVRFLGEAEAVARLRHPNVVQLYEAGRHNGLPYFTLEYVPSGSLADRLRGTPLPPREAAHLVEQLARGVAHAHRQGVVHRDLKPANVLLAEDGTPKVTDFGLAKRLEDGSGMTQSGAVMGTPSYMAPEQAAGKISLIGPAADTYALGATLYELLAGRPPFKAATTMDTLMQVLHDEPVSLRQLQPGTPRDLQTICLKCLQKEPGQRYATADELAEDLRRFLAGEPIQARPVGAVERAVKWARRRPALAAVYGLLLAVLVLGLGGGGALALWQRAEGARRQAETARRQAEGAERKAVEKQSELETTLTQLERTKEELQATKEELDRIASLDRIAAAQRHWEANEVRQARQLLQRCTPKYRTWVWNHLHLTFHAELAVLQGHTDAARPWAFSLDGTLLASAGDDKTVRLWDVAGRKELARFPGHTDGASFLTFSPDAKLLASTGGDKTVRLWDVTGRKELAQFPGHKVWVHHLTFSPDGKILASCSFDTAVRLWDVAGRKELATLQGHTDAVWHLTFSPDGKLLASAGKDAVVRLWDVASRKELGELQGHTAALHRVAFSPDGRLLASAGKDAVVRLWDVAGRKERGQLQGHTGDVLCLAFSRDGKRLASAGAGAVRLWDVADRKELATLQGHTDAIDRLAFSPDDKLLASAGNDGTARLWDVTGRKEVAELQGHGDQVTHLAFSPDGTLLASAGDDKTVRLWDVAGRKELARFQGHTGPVSHLAFSPDGKLLASASHDKTVRLWDVAGRKQLAKLQGHTDGVLRLAFSPDGTLLASVAGGDKAVRLWDVAGRKELATLQGHTEVVVHLAFSPDGKLLASASHDKTVRLWDVAGRKQLATLRGHTGEINYLTFSPDGKILASCSFDKTVRLWDVGGRKQLATLRGHTYAVHHLTFSPDGKLLGSAGVDKTARLWDVAGRKELAELQGHTAPVWHLTFSPDGRTLGSCSSDKTMRLWDVASRKELAKLRGHTDQVNLLSFSPDGTVLASAGSDKAVRLWFSTDNKANREKRWRAWPAEQARDSEMRGLPFSAAFFLNQLIKDEPKNPVLRARRGLARAGMQQWDGALTDFATTSTLDPANAWLHQSLQGLALLGKGDLTGYRSVCGRLLRQYGNTTDADTANMVSGLAVVLPGAVPKDQVGKLVALAKRAVKADPRNADYLDTLGDALYRAGAFKSAVEQLDQAVAMDGKGGAAGTQLFLAMAHHRLGNASEAKQWLAKAIEKIEKVQSSSWADRVQWQYLRQETETLLKTPALKP